MALSGDQKQRISIARAVVRNPRFHLLLDEATSSLDSATEKLIQDVLERTEKPRTMICIVHRLATIQNAHVIFVVSDRTTLEQGNHSALLQKRGACYNVVSRLSKLQEGFRGSL